MTGAEMIAAERQRQVEREGWTAEHDDTHDGGELALAACCYAAPRQLYVMTGYSRADRGVEFTDPWPWLWGWDRRRLLNQGNSPKPPEQMTDAERIDLLAKAGALIAAEIDRLQRLDAVPAQS